MSDFFLLAVVALLLLGFLIAGHHITKPVTLEEVAHIAVREPLSAIKKSEIADAQGSSFRTTYEVLGILFFCRYEQIFQRLDPCFEILTITIFPSRGVYRAVFKDEKLISLETPVEKFIFDADQVDPESPWGFHEKWILGNILATVQNAVITNLKIQENHRAIA